jgi:MFS family permease
VRKVAKVRVGVDGRPPTVRSLVLLLLCTAFFMVVTDSTLVYAALPSLGRELGLTHTSAQWVVTAYLVTFGGLLLLGGRVADLGRRTRVFVGGCAMFVIASLFAGVAWDGAALIGARVIQGAAAAVMVPAALALLTATYAEGRDRNQALGVWGGLAGVGATAGLLLGGPITQALGWRWVFLVNVPVGILVIVLAPVVLPRPPVVARPTPRLNVTSAVTATLALASVLYAMVGAPVPGSMPALPWAALGGAAVLATFFLRSERGRSDPLIPTRVVASRTRVGGNLVVLAAGMSVDGLLYGFTLLSQDVLDHSPSRFGLLAATMTGASFLGIGVAQRGASRYGARAVAVLALALIAFGAAVLATAPRSAHPTPALLGSLLTLGVGVGAAFVVGQIAALSGIADHDAGIAAGIEESVFSIGNALGVALVAAVAATHTGLATGLRDGFRAIALVALLGGLAALVLIDRTTGAPPALDVGGAPERIRTSTVTKETDT